MAVQSKPPGAAKETRLVRVGKLKVGRGEPLLIIAGPCVIESEQNVLRHARALKSLSESLKIPFVFKASFDKANRSSLRSYRGPGLRRGLDILQKVKHKTGLLLLSDIHSPEQAQPAGQVLDIIQIPALLSRQTDLIIEAAKTQKVINVKKGQFMAPHDMQNVVEKILSCGNDKILLTDRGTSFGYNTLVSDFRSLVIMRKMGFPVIYDATHSVQQPSAWGSVSGGEGEYAPALARAAVAVGCDGLFMEVHEKPERALSDGPTMIRLKELRQILIGLCQLSEVSDRVTRYR